MASGEMPGIENTNEEILIPDFGAFLRGRPKLFTPEEIPFFGLACEQALLTVIDMPEAAPTLSRFITTYDYLSQYPWCPEHWNWGRGEQEYSGLLAGMRRALATYEFGEEPVILEPEVSSSEITTILEQWRDPFIDSATKVTLDWETVVMFAASLRRSGLTVPQASASDVQPHIIRALERYAGRRYLDNSSSPW